jgi:hypothetical protein
LSARRRGAINGSRSTRSFARIEKAEEARNAGGDIGSATSFVSRTMNRVVACVRASIRSPRIPSASMSFSTDGVVRVLFDPFRRARRRDVSCR